MASPISLTTVVHHRTGENEHWTVLTGSTVVAHCTTFDQAAGLAETMNEAKKTGDEFDATKRYRSPAPLVAAPARPVRCQGLDITPTPQRAQALEPQLPPPG